MSLFLCLSSSSLGRYCQKMSEAGGFGKELNKWGGGGGWRYKWGGGLSKEGGLKPFALYIFADHF